MRHSPLLTTPLAQFLLALVAVGVLGGVCLSVAHTAFDLTSDDVLILATNNGIPAAVAVGLAVGAATSLGPAVIRFVLAKRILILLTLIALGLIEPLLAIVSVLAMLFVFGMLRAPHNREGSILAQFFTFNALSWPRRILYTFGGMLIVLAILTAPRLPMDIDPLLPWPLYSISGLATMLVISIPLGYITGNNCFPRLLRSRRRWAMLAFFGVMLKINPFVGFVSVIHGLVLVIIERAASNDDADNESKRRSITHCACGHKYGSWQPPCHTAGCAVWEGPYSGDK